MKVKRLIILNTTGAPTARPRLS